MSATRVLLVEDDPGYARFLREVLLEVRGAEHDITCAQTLEAAEARLAEASFDVILLDLGLPDADGTEALTRITSCARAIPLVVLSSHDDLDVALESMRLGAQEYLVKGQAEHALLPRAMRYAIERKRLQDAAIAARQEAEHANTVKDDFLAMLGHELRNPLAPIVTALALMERHKQPEIARELTILQRQVQQVVRLVDDLLDVARIVRGKVELKREDLDLADIVAIAIEMAQPLYQERRHTLQIDVPRGQLWVNGDASRLAQIVANLLTNAAKYTLPQGTVWISGRVDGETVEMRVRDTGIGMREELLQRVFGLFEQGPRTIDRSVGGLGLGLAIVRNIAVLHGGSVTATSDGPGKGSELVLRLPQIVRPRASAPPAAPRLLSPVPAAGVRRVLIVDDNYDNAELLEQGLKSLGHVTCVAHDGEEAIELASQFAPDVALLDIGLPIIDGYEAARRMRAQLGERAPFLVAITGYGQESDRARSRSAGFDQHLVKPIELSRLANIVATAPKQT
jgi:signal transduction histidine kinase